MNKFLLTALLFCWVSSIKSQSEILNAYKITNPYGTTYKLIAQPEFSLYATSLGFSLLNDFGMWENVEVNSSGRITCSNTTVYWIDDKWLKSYTIASHSYAGTLLPNNLYVSALCVDKLGKIWLASYYGDLYVFDTNTSIFSAIACPAIGIKTLEIDSTNNLLVGTFNQGLFLFDGSAWDNYTMAEGLAGNSINDIYVSASNTIYLANDIGITEIADGIVTKWDNSNGLIGNYFATVCKTTTGELYTSNTTGIQKLTNNNWQMFDATKKQINAIREEHKGAILFAGDMEESAGLYKGNYFDFFAYKEQPDIIREYFEPTDSTRFLLMKKRGFLYDFQFGTSMLLYFNGIVWNPYFKDNKENVNAGCVDRNGTFWVWIEGAMYAINGLDSTRYQLPYFRAIQESYMYRDWKGRFWMKYENNSSLRISNIYSNPVEYDSIPFMFETISNDALGQVWVKSYGGDLHVEEYGRLRQVSLDYNVNPVMQRNGRNKIALLEINKQSAIDIRYKNEVAPLFPMSLSNLEIIKGLAADTTEDNFLMVYEPANQAFSVIHYNEVDYEIIPINYSYAPASITLLPNNRFALHYVYGRIEIFQYNTLENVSRLPENKSLTIYPNPASGIVFFESELNTTASASIVVYDYLGRIVQTKDYDEIEAGYHIHQLDLSALKNGIYIVTISMENQLKTQQICVVK